MILNIKNTVLVFDLDDTLYNEIDYLKSAYKSIALLLDKDNSLQLYAKMFSLFRLKSDVFEFLTKKYNIEKEKLISHYRNHTPDIKPFEHTVPFLEKIKKLDGKIGLITDGRVNTQNNKLYSLGLMKYFDSIIISEAIGTEKPDSNNFKILEKNIPSSKYVYIADNFKKDFITPNNRNWTTVGLIDNGLNIHNNCFEYYSRKYYAPHFLINDFNDIKLTRN